MFSSIVGLLNKAFDIVLRIWDGIEALIDKYNYNKRDRIKKKRKETAEEFKDAETTKDKLKKLKELEK